LRVQSKDPFKCLESEMSEYTWEYGSSEAGLRFTVTYDGSQFAITVHEGHMDLNALWFANDDGTGANIKLTKADASLNMNGSTLVWDEGSADSEKISWDLYQKTSSTGVTNDGFYLTAGQTMSFDASAETYDWLNSQESIENVILGIRATSTSTEGGSIKWADALATSNPSEIIGDRGDNFIEGRNPEYNFLYGDADELTGASQGGNDVIKGAEGAFWNFMNGDAYTMKNSSVGGNDILTGGNMAEYNEAYGDAVDMYGNSIGGDDVILGGFGSQNKLTGDGNRMQDNVRGGNDDISGGEFGRYDMLIGDAEFLGGAGENDSIIAGNDTLRGGNDVYGYSAMYGDGIDAREAESITFGNDRLISGTNSSDEMWGDAAFHNVTGERGSDTFVFSDNFGQDFIMDFEVGHDKIEISGVNALVDRNSDGVVNYNDLEYYIFTNSGTNDTYIDFRDNSGNGSVITVVGVVGLTASDFVIS
jgi:hypothetical protein